MTAKMVFYKTGPENKTGREAVTGPESGDPGREEPFPEGGGPAGEDRRKGGSTGGAGRNHRDAAPLRPVVLACLSASPGSRRVIRAAAKLGRHADRRIALYVDAGRPGAAEASRDTMLQQNIRFAQLSGFEVRTAAGKDLAAAISEAAKKAGATDIFIGYSPPSFFLQAKRPFHEKLLRLLPDADIHVIPSPVTSPYPGAMREAAGEAAWNVRDLLGVLIIMAAATALSFLFYHSRFSNANIITIYILAVLIASVVTSSRLYGLLAAVLYVLLFNFLFIDPRFSLVVYDSAYLVTYFVTAVAALITGTVTVRMKNIARVSAENAYQAKILLDTVEQLKEAEGEEEIVRTTCLQLVNLLNRPVAYWTGGKGGSGDAAEAAGTGAARSGPDGASGSCAMEPAFWRIFPAGTESVPREVLAGERDASMWAYENCSEAGASTSRFADCACRYLSVYAGADRFGVAAIRMDGGPLTEFEETILLSIVHECTMALENRRMEAERNRARLLAEKERMRAGLLRSISHDLRTPLTAILGNASNLRSHESAFSGEERDRIYGEILEDAGWLNAQFENILYMTRLEGGRGLQKTVESMEDVVEESLRHMAPHPSHEVTAAGAEQPLLCEMDAGLIMQVLINLLNNAVKYTPNGSTVRVRMERQGGWACVEVADDGPGIPDVDKPHIFELFYTGSHVQADSSRSMGIGLNLCAQIIGAHGGVIGVSDNLPHGAVFCFRLPAVGPGLQEPPPG